ncbi:MAG: metallophosphoesterase family protein [Thermoplasmatota archaeon]
MKKLAVFAVLVFIASTVVPAIGVQETTNTSLPVLSDSEAISSSPVRIHFPGDPQPDGGAAIVVPRSTMPVIVPQDGSFVASVRLDGTPSGWKASLATAYDPVEIEQRLAVTDTVFNDTTGCWDVTATVPSSLPPDLYNLTVEVECQGELYQLAVPRAVSIVSEYESRVSFVHLTDFHIGDPRGFKENFQQTLGWKAAKKSIQEINLLHPDFVVITGDLVFGQLYPFEYTFEYRTCYEILQQFDVPTYLVPGNHDGYIQTGQDGFTFWERYFGPLYYSFDYDDCHFTGVNSYDWPNRSRHAISYAAFNWGGHVQEEQLAWIEQDLARHSDAFNVVLLHHNPLWETVNDSLLGNGYLGREELLSLIDEYTVDACFAGHVHYDDVTIRNDTTYITTTTVSSGTSGDAYWGYRMVSMQDGCLTDYIYEEPDYSIPLYRLNYSYTTNDGSTGTVEATVENNLAMPVQAYLQFYVPPGSYSVDRGVIVGQREGNNMLHLLVTADIDAMATETVTVRSA